LTALSNSRAALPLAYRSDGLASGAGAGPHLSQAVRQLVLAYVWLTFASIAIDIKDPAPYDLMLLLAALILPLTGFVRYSRGLAVYLLVWMTIVAFGYISTTQAGIYGVPTGHTTITLFLSFTATVLVGFIACDPRRYIRLIMSGYVLSAVIAVTAALIGYFHLVPGAYGLFTKFDGRTRGTFQDPNVYGAFLVPAILYCFNLMLTKGFGRAMFFAGLVAYMLFGVLLGLSRGSWINLGLSLVLFAFFTFSTAGRSLQRLKLIVSVIFAGVLMVGVFTAATDISRFANLFSERAKLEQSYDQGPEGRFGGQREALSLLVTHPLGIGALEFARVYHGEDVHEVYLSTFLNTGWVGGFLYLGMVIATIVLGIRQVIADRGGDGVSAVLAASYIGMAFEGLIIDSDHWRHFHLIMAMIWGMALASQARRRPNGATDAAGREISALH
jgi:O-Antigen ligase